MSVVSLLNYLVSEFPVPREGVSTGPISPVRSLAP